jgi:hypothetical protein
MKDSYRVNFNFSSGEKLNVEVHCAIQRVDLVDLSFLFHSHTQRDSPLSLSMLVLYRRHDFHYTSTRSDSASSLTPFAHLLLTIIRKME